jgi:hypothetical protein
MSALEKRKSGVLSPTGTGSGLALGMAAAPMATLALAFLLPGGFLFWAFVMLVIGVITY